MAKEVKHLTEVELNAALPKLTAEKFKVVNMSKRTSTRFFTAKFGLVDLSTLTVAAAESLIAKGADFIKAVPQKESKNKTEA